MKLFRTAVLLALVTLALAIFVWSPVAASAAGPPSGDPAYEMIRPGILTSREIIFTPIWGTNRKEIKINDHATWVSKPRAAAELAGETIPPTPDVYTQTSYNADRTITIKTQAEARFLPGTGTLRFDGETDPSKFSFGSSTGGSGKLPEGVKYVEQTYFTGGVEHRFDREKSYTATV